MELSKEQIDQMLEEVAGYQVDLAEDPTLPHLGLAYLQKSVALCRNYTNRTVFYLQKVLRYDKELKREIRVLELDLEFKMREKLADDAVVRQQSSIEDRRATAAVMLRSEHEVLAERKAHAVDAEESAKLLRMKYNDLQRTSNEIKLQRQMVKDDMESQLRGDAGYSRPVVNEDRSVPDGMRAPVAEKVDPKDLLDPSRRPEEMPEPKDEGHAQMISEFLSRNPEKPQAIPHPGSAAAATPERAPEPGIVAGVDYEALLDL